MNLKNLFKNDDAVSISIGFILMLSVMVIVFVAIILSFYTLSEQAEKTAMRESFEILGSELAIQVTTVDTLVNISNSYGGTVNTLEYDISIPTSIAGKAYTVNITNDGKEIILEADNGAKAWVPFNISADIEPAIFSSGAEYYKIKYDDEEKEIKIEEQ